MMSVQHLQLNIRSLSIDLDAADQLLRMSNGDAALLYLYLLRSGGAYDPLHAGQTLGWGRTRLDTALAQLQEVGLAAGASLPPIEEPPPQPDQAPEYTAEDIVSELSDEGSTFSALLQEAEAVLGRRLNNQQTAILLELYDHVGLPSEVLLLMINWLSEQNRKKYGTGKKLSMAQIKRTGYQWKERGYDTLDAADEYIRSYDLRQSSQGALLSALGIHGRQANVTESRFLNQWQAWGFPPESVAHAYEITVTGIGHLDWRYCNGILRKWHEKGLHTPEQVRSERKPEPRQPGQSSSPPKDPQALERENRRKLEESRRVLEKAKREN